MEFKVKRQEKAYEIPKKLGVLGGFTEGSAQILISLELSVNLARVQARLTLDIPP